MLDRVQRLLGHGAEVWAQTPADVAALPPGVGMPLLATAAWPAEVMQW